MKHLTILRHAKAAAYGDYPVDFDRPLTGKGRKQIPRIMRALKGNKKSIDWIVSSPALRARQTAELVAQTLGRPQKIIWDERIYEASAPTLLGLLQEVPDSAEHVLIVGHNPGLESLTAGLCTGNEARLCLRLTTAGLAHLRPEIVRWRQLRWGCGELRVLTAPRYGKK